MADQHNRFRTRAAIRFRKAPAEHGGLTDQLEAVWGNVAPGVELGNDIVATDPHRPAGRGERQGRPRAARPLPILEVPHRHAKDTAAGIARVDVHDSVRLVERKASQEHGIRQREYRAVRADAQRERDDGRHGEPWVLP